MAHYRSPRAPNLTIAPPAYSPSLQEATNNQLRLYFNQLDFTASALLQQSANLTIAQWLGFGGISKNTAVGGGSSGATVFTALTDCPASYVGQAAKFVVVRGDELGLEFVTGGGGATTFLALTDTPSSYASQKFKRVTVNSAETALVFSADRIAYPEDYGAVGDGTTDDTTACATCIALGGVQVWEQTYLVTGLTVSVNNTVMLGKGTIQRKNSTAGDLVTITGTDVYWDGPNINGRRANQAATDDLLYINGARFTMVAGKVYGSLGRGIYGSGANIAGTAILSPQVLVTECDMEGIYLDKTTATDVSGVTIDGVVVDLSSEGAGYTYPAVYVAGTAGTVFVTDVIVSNNTVRLPSDADSSTGILLENVKRYTVDNNSIYGGGVQYQAITSEDGGSKGNKYYYALFAGADHTSCLRVSHIEWSFIAVAESVISATYTSCVGLVSGLYTVDAGIQAASGNFVVRYDECTGLSIVSPNINMAENGGGEGGSALAQCLIISNCHNWSMVGPVITTDAVLDDNIAGIQVYGSSAGGDNDHGTISGGSIKGFVNAIQFFADTGAVLDQISVTGVDVTGCANSFLSSTSGGGVLGTNIKISGCQGVLTAGTLSSDYFDYGSVILSCTRASTPEGAVTANVGSVCYNTATGAIYTKTSGTGNTGWTISAGGTGDFVPTYLETGAGIPASIGTAYQQLRVNSGATALEFAYGLGAIGTTKQMLQVNAGATGLEYIDRPLDISFGFGGTYTASQELARITFVRAGTFPASLTGSFGSSAGAPTSTSVVLDLKKNGTSFGSATFAAAATTCTFSAASSTSFAAGDIFTMVAPAGLNATFTDCGITLRGVHS